MKTNREKRSVLLSFILGDGCLHRSGPAQRNKMGYISIKHGEKQKDYLEWKAKILEQYVGKKINTRPASSYVKALDKAYPQWALQFGWKRMRAWRGFCYPNNEKSLRKILPFITTPELAAAIWLGDDGTVSSGRVDRNDNSKGRVYSGLVLYLGDIAKEDAEAAREWFIQNYRVYPRIRWQGVKYKGTTRFYPELRFTVLDGLKLWQTVGPILSKIPSMAHKFRLLIERTQRTDLPQPQTPFPNEKLLVIGDDIVLIRYENR